MTHGFFNYFTLIFGWLGGILVWLVGGYDEIFYALVAFVIFDYFSGIFKAIFEKNLSSKIGYTGILKKVLIFSVIALANIIEKLLHIPIPIREITIMFYIANEGMSIVENIGSIIPLPKKLQDIFTQLKDESEDKNNDKEL